MVKACGFNSSEIVFAQLITIITFYMRPITIDVRGFNFKRFFFYFFPWYLSLQNYLNNLLKNFFCVLGNVYKNIGSFWSGKRFDKRFD